MIRSKGEAGTGNIVEAVRHLRGIVGGIRRSARWAGAAAAARPRSCGAPFEVVEEVARERLAPGAAVLRRRDRHACGRGPGHAARRRGELRGLGNLQVGGPGAPARAIVEATTHFSDAERVAAASIELGEPMRGDDIAQLAAEGELLQQRGV